MVITSQAIGPLILWVFFSREMITLAHYVISLKRVMYGTVKSTRGFFWRGAFTVCMVLGLRGFCRAASGTEGASFLDIPVGGRPAALGSAYSAMATDVYATVWNPAGLGFLRSMEVSGQH